MFNYTNNRKFYIPTYAWGTVHPHDPMCSDLTLFGFLRIILFCAYFLNSAMNKFYYLCWNCTKWRQILYLYLQSMEFLRLLNTLPYQVTVHTPQYNSLYSSGLSHYFVNTYQLYMLIHIEFLIKIIYSSFSIYITLLNAIHKQYNPHTFHN